MSNLKRDLYYYKNELVDISIELLSLENGFGSYINRHGVIDFRKSSSGGVSGILDNIDVFFNKNVWKLKDQEIKRYQLRVDIIIKEMSSQFPRSAISELLIDLEEVYRQAA
ncbi:MAG: hypothetical protein K9K67_14280 [Bacteriovoracaceae bacterium]|nr:hypothetical protein [Bacteriovoracaceae bacterium]